MAAGVKAAGTGIAGSVLSLFETAAKSTDNYVLEQNRDYIEKTADELDLWKDRLKLAQQGQGDPSWGSIKHLEQRVRIAENLDKLRRSGSTVDPNALGQRLMRQSQEYTREATRGMEGPDRFLTETAISIGQNLPGMAAAAIPVVGPAVGAALMGAQAAGAKAFELNERGISPDEAFQRGLVSGGIELVTEKIPLGSLAKILGGKSGTNAAKNILKQMGIEASEESASYVANYLADKIAKDPKAEWSWQELMENAAAGAVSGGVFGTAGSMIGELRQKSTGTNVQNQVQDVERTVGTGVNRKTLEEIDQVSRLLGVQTRFADQVAGGLANAELRGNTITIERNNPNPVRFLYGHEITHRMQAVSPEGYAKFRDIIAREEGVQTQVEEVLREAGEMGLQYSRDQALDEVAADYAGALIENERLLQKFIQENRGNKTLLQRMAEAFRELLDKLRGRDTTKIENAVEALELAMKETVKGSRLLTGREAAVKARRTAQEKRFLANRRDDLMGQVIRDYQEGNLEVAAREEVDRAGVEALVDGYLSGKQNPKLAEFTRRMQAYEEMEARYSFKRAGDTVAQQAQQMEDQGEDRETIWKETGAIRDTRGNWVEEVDDSGAKFYPLGDAKRQGNPDWVRLKALENKMLAGTITQEELEEARGLAQATRGMPNGTTLGDYLDHPELFQAAPGIENTPFRMADIGTKGERTGRGITLNQNLPADQRLSTALHETQHELQGLEGRPGGSGVEYWRAKGTEDAKELYRRTAGEIEARETQRRMNMTAQERRENMPDLGWDQAVFADDSPSEQMSAEEKGAIHNELLEKVQATAQTLGEPLAELTGEEFTKGEKNLVQQVGEYFDQLGGQVERQGFGTVRLSRRGIKDSMGHGLGRKKAAAFAAVQEVIQNGVQIDYQKDWKGRGYDTYVFAGGVTIAGEPNVMGVVVIRRNEDNRFYLHEVTAIKKGDAATFKTGGTEDGRLPGDAESPSKTSIPGTEGESNGKLSTKGLSSYERAYETVYGKPLEPPKTVKESVEQAYVGIIDRLQRVEVQKPKERKVPPLPTADNKPLVKPSEINEETISADDMAYMDELIDAAEEESAPAEAKQDKRNDRLIEEAERLIPGGEGEKSTLGEQIKDATGFAYRKLVDSGEEIRKAGKQSGDKYLYSYYNQAKASTAIAQNMIAMHQSDVNGKEVGESLVSIFGPIKKKGTEYFKEFESYLLHRHNIDRMGTKEDLQMLMQAKRYLKEFDRNNPEIASMSRADLEHAARNGGELAKERLDMLEEKARWESIVKPVFGYQVTAEISQGRVKKLEGMHPEFKELAERVYGYSRNMMQYRVDSGLIDQRTADYLQRRYPHYVPTFRRQDGVNTAKQEKGVRVGKTIKRAKGSDAPLMDIDKAMAQQTMNTVREGSKNRFGQRLLSDKISQDYVINVQSVAAQKQKMDLEEAFRNEQTTKDNTFTVYQDGRAYEITMTPEMFEGIKGLTPTGENDKRAMKAVITANNIYKKAITSWNPVFTLKNWLKDFQDALLYTSDLKGFAKNYFGPALKQIVKNGDEWKLYQALGGTSASVYNSDKGVEMPKDSRWAKLVGKISAINLAVEQWPRLAEFMATAQKGNRTQEELMEAMYNAADITTNFGRSGQATKWLNATFVPFLNPSIQGMDKVMRTIRDNPQSFGAWFSLAAKAAVLGIAPAILNYAIFGDEEDYDNLNQRDLDTNFMFSLGKFNVDLDGMWIKIPRGRALSAIQAVGNAGINLARGKKVDPGELIDTVWTNIGVINPLNGNIMKAWEDTALGDPDNPGKTWYGGDIESQSMQNKAPHERYDERTDEFSKWAANTALGKKLEWSPAKLNYLIDSYTGVIGDIVLPWMTPKDASGVGPQALKPLARPFVTDSVTSNRISRDFYDMGDELKYADQSGSGVDKIAAMYWNKMSEKLSELNRQIRIAENDHGLDYKEKRQHYRDLKKQANDLMLETMSNMAKFRTEAEKYAENLADWNVKNAFLKTTRDMFGAEKALEFDGKDVYKKAKEANEAGVSYDTYLDFKNLMKRYDAIRDTRNKLDDLDEAGETGDLRGLYQAKLDKLTAAEQDLISSYTGKGNGWKPSGKDEKLSIIESMELPEEEAFALWKTAVADEYDLEDLEELESKGLPAMEYYRYRQAVKFLNGYEDPQKPGRTKSYSKQDQRLPVINSLNLTTKQKDLLWFDNGWSESALYWKAPWH